MKHKAKYYIGKLVKANIDCVQFKKGDIGPIIKISEGNGKIGRPNYHYYRIFINGNVSSMFFCGFNSKKNTICHPQPDDLIDIDRLGIDILTIID